MTATKTKPQITSLPIKEIEPIEGLNPRQSITADSIAELAASIEQVGVLMPVLVAERSNGHWPLIAGSRRWLAAQKAGLTEIPALVRADLAGSELEAAITENAQRLDLDPIEEAMAIRRLMDDKNLKQVDAAKAMGKSERWLRERLRLLRLPAHTQRIFAERRIPIEAAVQLEKIAKAAPDVADLVAVKAKHGKVEPASLTSPTGAGNAAIEAIENADGLTLVRVNTGDYARDEAYSPADLPLDPDVLKELQAQWKEIPKVPHFYGGRASERAKIEFDAKDAELARADGALLELTIEGWGGQQHTARFITSPATIETLVRTKLPKMAAAAKRKLREKEKRQAEVADRRSQREKRQAEVADRRSQRGEDGAAERKRAEAEREARAEEIRKLNAELGERLAPLDSVALNMDVVRLLCSMAIGHEELLADSLNDGGYGHTLLAPDRETDDWFAPAEELIEELAGAETAEAAAAIVVRFAIAQRFGADPRYPDGHGYTLTMLGPESNPALNFVAQVEHIAQQLGVLPEPLARQAKEEAKRRAQIRKEAAERAARVEAAKAEQAGEDKSK